MTHTKACRHKLGLYQHIEIFFRKSQLMFNGLHVADRFAQTLAQEPEKIIIFQQF